MKFTFAERQIAFGLCTGMSDKRMAKALDTTPFDIGRRVRSLLLKTGMSSRLEFALVQNAAVRELVHGAEAA